MKTLQERLVGLGGNDLVLRDPDSGEFVAFRLEQGGTVSVATPYYVVGGMSLADAAEYEAAVLEDGWL